ncbi:MAG TPA: alpha/beta-hydrolase family protein [Actinomycetes bacterium]
MADVGSVAGRVLGAAGRGMQLPERAGILAASTSVGRSYSRGLLPRATADQAIVTGVSVTVNYALTALAQSMIESGAFRVTGVRPMTRAERIAHRNVVLVGNVAAMGAGVLAQRLLAQRKDEPIARAWGRATSWRVAVGGLSGSILLGLDAAFERLSGEGSRDWWRRVPIALPLGGTLAAVEYRALRKGMQRAGIETDAAGMPLKEEGASVATGRALLVGTGVSAGLLVLAEGERLFADGVGVVVQAVSPRAELIAKPIGHLAAVGLLAGAGYAGLQKVFRKAEHGGDAVEAAYRTPPTSDFVSGGPRSSVSWGDVGREGRRFVNMALTPAEITEVMDEPAMAPIRVFVGLESNDTTSGRADLAMRELEALGAFERKLIVFMSPTGTGYLNYVTAEALEYLSRGDVACVAMQYSLRPSPMSLGRVGIGIDQNNAFLHALKWRLHAIPEDRRPRLAIFGESLGAQTSLDVFQEEGARGFSRVGLERGLFLGTPANTKWRQRWLSEPSVWDPHGEVVEVDSYEEYLALPEEVRERARYFLLSHHNDPMPKFWFPLAVQAPDWLGPAESREPGVPPEVAWRPYTTFLVTLIDVKNAMNVIPGKFVAKGHDYRKDLARFTSLAYDLPLDDARMERMERALRQRELAWAQRRLLADQSAQAEAKVREQLAKWGVPEERVPALLSSGLAVESDEYAAT